MRRITSVEALYWSVGLLALSIPLYKKIIPFFIIIFIICWAIYFVKQRKQIQFDFNIIRICSIILFAIYALSMLVTTDIQKGKFDLEVKLSLLIFSLLLSLVGKDFWSKKHFQNILMLYVLSTIIVTTISFGIAFYRCFTIFFTKDFFTYAYLANIYHPTYLAMFINLSITILLLKLVEDWQNISVMKRVGLCVLLFYLMLFVFLLNSKAGILVMFLNVLGIIFVFTVFKKQLWVVLLLVGGIIISSVMVVKMVPFVNVRFVEMISSIKNIKNISPNTENDSEQRILIWKYSADIISTHWITGVGAGDVSAHLTNEYVKNEFYHGTEKNLNCHNQFVQTFVATGIGGFIILLLLVFSILILAIRRKSILGLSLFIIVTVTMLTESILEVQSGTVFFGFFIAFLFSSKSD